MLDVTLDPTGGYRCKDAISHEVTSGEEAMRVYADGCKQRATASTNMNAGTHAFTMHERRPGACTYTLFAPKHVQVEREVVHVRVRGLGMV